MTHTINKDIDVTAYYFKGGKSFPRRIQIGQDELTFLESGLKCLVKTGQQFIEIFNMSDGRDYYTIRHEQGRGNWTLLNKRALV